MKQRRVEFSVGIDIEDIARFVKVDGPSQRRLLQKIFTKRELGYCLPKQKAAEHLAARFAGKEAVIKALKCLDQKNISYLDVEIVNRQDGAPFVRLSKARNWQIQVSLAHCDDKAIACAFVMARDIIANKRFSK